MSRLLRIVLALALLVAACGGGASLETDLKLNTDPSSTLLTITSGGGFVPAEFLVNNGPYLVVTRGGQMISQGPMIEIYPGPLVANWVTADLDQETMLFILEELDAMGIADILEESNDEASSVVADGPTTTLTFYNSEGPHSFSVYALGMGEVFTDPRVTVMENLVNQLSNLGVGSGDPYLPEAVQVVAGPFGGVEPELGNDRDWPLPISFKEMAAMAIVNGWSCAAFEGTEANAVLAALSQGNQATVWHEGEASYQIQVRPLFPGETACAQAIFQ